MTFMLCTELGTKQNKTMISSYAFWLLLDNKWLLLAVTLPASLAQ